MRHADIGNAHRETDPETTPLHHPELYQYDFDLAAISEVPHREDLYAGQETGNT